MTPDAELLRRYAEERDEAAFAELVQRHVPLVYSAALRRMGGDAHGAADVTQQVFTMLARRAVQVARHPVPTAWLYTATRNAAIDLLRAQARRRHHEQEAHIMNLAMADQAPDPEWEKLRPILDGVIDELGETDRAAVLLRFFERRSFGEIGEALRMKEDAARIRVQRALEKLHALLARRGVGSSAAALGLVMANQAAAAVVPSGLTLTVTSAALAGGSAGTITSVAGIIGFMSTVKTAVTIAVVLAVLGVGSAVYENARGRDAESAAAVLRKERDALQARETQLAAKMREADRQVKTSEERVAALETELAAARSAQGAGRVGASVSTMGTVTTGPAPGGANVGLEVMANPEYVRLSVEKFRRELGLQYAALYKKLGLTPEQIAKFEANRLEWQQTNQEIWSAAVAKGVSVSDPSITNMMREPSTNLEKELMAQLGDAGYKQYSQYSRAKSGLDVVASLAGNLYQTEPLSAQQGEQLAQAMINNTRMVPTAPGAKSMRSETDWAGVVAQTQGVLTPTQAAVFDSVVAAKKLAWQLNELSAAMRRPAAAGNAKPGGG